MLTTKEKTKDYISSYSFKRVTVPYPSASTEKIKPPTTELELQDSAELFKVKEESLEEKAQKYMDSYRKVERAIVCNFYTGGGVYTKGILDSLYKGFNPLNP